LRAGTITDRKGAGDGGLGVSALRDRDRATRTIASGGSKIHGAAARSAVRWGTVMRVESGE
jgi:hypothetical protein